MSDLTPETVEAALSIRGPGGISQSRTLTGSDHVIREAAQKWANPDIDAAIEARFNYIDTSREPVTQIVLAALGVTEDK